MSWKAISLVAFMLMSACRPITPQVPTGSGTHAVRGYIAVAVGNSAKAESGGIYSRAIAGKDVSARSDGISARRRNWHPQRSHAHRPQRPFHAVRRRQRALPHLLGIQSVRQQLHHLHLRRLLRAAVCDTVNISVPPRQDYVAMIGHVTTADGSVPRAFDPLLNINSFAMVGFDDGQNTRLRGRLRQQLRRLPAAVRAG